MTTSRITRDTVKEVVKIETPAEVNNLRALLHDNGWKLCMDRIDSTIRDIQELVMQDIPAWITQEEELIRYKWQEKKKLLAKCYMELKELPYVLMREYGESSFDVDRSTEV